MTQVNILGADNGVGLTRSTKIVAETLAQAGFSVRARNFDEAPQAGKYFDVNIFLERLNPEWFERASVNLMIPNQEWFLSKDLPYLHHIDGYLCKTHHAQEIFSRLGCQTRYTSFTSRDRFDPSVAKDFNAYFHLAGRSQHKGTKTLLDVWQRHSNWPILKVIQHPETRLPVEAKNIEYQSEYLSDDDLRHLQNVSGVQICASKAEGFGHTLVEAMACKAVIVTTDAPPMNEIVTPHRGVLAGYQSTEPHNQGILFSVDPGDLEKAIEHVINMSDSEKQRLGEQARAWYEQNDHFFVQALPEAVNHYLNR